MEDLEIVGETLVSENVSTLFTSLELTERRLVWQAISELWLYEKMTDYDLNYIAIRLSDSSFSKTKLQDIFEKEVRPVIAGGQYIMNNEWHVIEANWLEDSILKHLQAVKIAQENQSLPAKFLKKFGFSARKQDEVGGEGAQRVTLYWQAIKELVLAMREQAHIGDRQQQYVLQPPAPFAGE